MSIYNLYWRWKGQLKSQNAEAVIKTNKNTQQNSVSEKWLHLALSYEQSN